MRTFTPLGDLILVKPDPLPGQVGSIVIAETTQNPGHRPGHYADTFTGTVVAVGPGDRIFLLRCRQCGADCRRIETARRFRCRACGGALEYTGDPPDYHPMQTKVGDRVAFPRRPNAPGGADLIQIDGEGYVTFNEEQSALAVIED